MVIAARGIAPGVAAPEESDTRGLRLRCDNVGCTYPSRNGAVRALDHVSLTARENELVSIVGPSGCGKSTLLRIIAGLQQPTDGRVVFENDRDSSRPRCGLVFQEFGTFPWMTVLENLAFGLEMEGVPRAERLARAATFAERLGLSAFARHYPRELSVGMRQRVDIGRAFLSNAPVLLMDEPFGALDAQTRRVLQQELLSIWQASRRLVLFITHDVDEAVLLADRVIVMSGRPGTVREVITVPLPRPRDVARDRQHMLELSWHIWQLLESDVRRGLSIR
ncbi:MAG: ABC transporter ATP-binding protein [Gemmatimonadota bacterium]|nr:ABC transporter ATP-binding protein [Gemmatimonadota bacterium]